MPDRPDFIIIGAMKCATSTLHEQLARQPGIFMSTPKEPNFFSNDEEYTRGVEVYRSLFHAARSGDLCGESSTHYTKLPTYPDTVRRMFDLVPEARLVYMMRDPVKRLRSQYVHEWSQCLVSWGIDEAIDRMPELVHYSRYATQLEPYLEAYGPAKVLPVFVERLRENPQRELVRVCSFLGYQGVPQWVTGLEEQNTSATRLRRSRWRDALAYAPVVSTFRRNLVPQVIREWVKGFWKLKAPPRLGEEAFAQVVRELDPEMRRLGRWLGVDLTCANFSRVVTRVEGQWFGTTVRAP